MKFATIGERKAYARGLRAAAREARAEARYWGGAAVNDATRARMVGATFLARELERRARSVDKEAPNA